MTNELFSTRNLRSRSASAENRNATPGAGGQARGGRKGSPCIWPLRAGATETLLDATGPGLIRRIWATVPVQNPDHLRNVILRIYWDDQEQPSVEAPIGAFFGLPFGYWADMLSDCVAVEGSRGLNCWIPMPFNRRARITVENDSETDVLAFFYEVDFTVGHERWGADAGYFHAQYRRVTPPLGTDHVIVDGLTGPGVYLGTVIGVRDLCTPKHRLWFGEGEVKFFLDGDKEYPTLCGTGLEDYAGYAWGIDPVLTRFQGSAFDDKEAGLYSFYRFHVPDPIYFQTSLKATVQQLGWGRMPEVVDELGPDAKIYTPAVDDAGGDDACYFERSDDWTTVAYWFQPLPSPAFPALPDRAARSAGLHT